MNTIITTLAKIIVAPIVFTLSIAGYSFDQKPLVYPSTEYQQKVEKYIDNKVSNIKTTYGAAPDYISGTTYTLAGTGLSSSATSITLTSLTVPQTGQKIQTSDLIAGAGNKFYVTIEPGSRTKQEIVSCTGITQNVSGTATLTGCSRGLSPITPYTASTTLRFVHAGGSQVIFSNPPQLYKDIISYIDNASISGAVDSSATVKGIVEKATASEAASHASIGSGNTTAPLVLTTDISSSTRLANTPQVVISSTTGYIDDSYISTSTLFSTISFASSTKFTNGNRVIEVGSNLQIFTVSGTFTVPSGVTRVCAEVVGAGAGGGSSNTSANSQGSGGGGGGYGFGCYDVSATTTIGITIGALGTGGTTGVGSNGGTTYFSTFMNCTGGTGGSRGSGSGGTGGTCTGANFSVNGQNGQAGVSGVAGVITGNGGGSILGMGGVNQSISEATGGSGTGYGSAGAGAKTTSGSEQSGGNGTAGLVKITW